jgi:hypothetical protein
MYEIRTFLNYGNNLLKYLKCCLAHFSLNWEYLVPSISASDYSGNRPFRNPRLSRNQYKYYDV